MKIADVLRVFRKLDMRITEGRDTNAKFIHEGKVVVYTRISHGKGDIAGRIPHLIRQQLRVNEDQFRELVGCSLRRQEYEQILRSKGLID